jgi:hypothetical protein
MAIPETNRTRIYSKVETMVGYNTTPSRHNRSRKQKTRKDEDEKRMANNEKQVAIRQRDKR